MQVTHRDTVNMIAETTGAALITKGVYVPPGKQAPEGERKIYLLIEGPTEGSVKHAKQVRSAARDTGACTQPHCLCSRPHHPILSCPASTCCRR